MKLIPVKALRRGFQRAPKWPLSGDPSAHFTAAPEGAEEEEETTAAVTWRPENILLPGPRVACARLPNQREKISKEQVHGSVPRRRAASLLRSPYRTKARPRHRAGAGPFLLVFLSFPTCQITAFSSLSAHICFCRGEGYELIIGIILPCVSKHTCAHTDRPLWSWGCTEWAPVCVFTRFSKKG